MTGLINKVRRYWDSRPCNIKHSNKVFGTRKYFDEVEKRKYLVEPHILPFADFSRWKGKKVLEIGCGIGTDSINFARAGAILTLVDMSKKSIKICKKRFSLYNLKAKFYQGNAEELSSFVSIEKYDLIYSFGVIHHTPHPEKLIQELKKYCSKETEIRLMLYAKWSWKVLWIVLKYGHGTFWNIDALVRTYSEAQIGSPVSYVYSFDEVKKLLKGFKIISMNKNHIFPFKIDKYVRYEYEKVWYFRFMPSSLFRLLERILGWHILIAARLV